MKRIRRHIAIAACLMAIVASARGQVVVDDTTTITVSDTSPFKLSGFDPSSSDKLVVTMSDENGSTITSVTYDGVAMTLAAYSANNGKKTYIFYLDNPAVSAGDLVWNTGTVGGAVLALSNVRPGVAVTNGAPAKSVTLQTVSSNMFIVASHVNNGGVSSAAQAPLTALFDGDTGSSWGASGYRSVPATGTLTTNTFIGSTSFPSTVAAGFESLATPGALTWFDVSVSSITSNSASLSAELAGTNADVTVYWEAGTVTDPASHSGWDGTNGPSAESTGTVVRAATGLSPDTFYTFAFYGSEGAQEAWSSVLSFSTGFADGQTPGFTGISQQENFLKVELNWQDNASHETAYHLQRATNGGTFATITTAIASDAVAYTDVVDTAGEYIYRLAATNSSNGSATDFTLCETNITVTIPAFGVAKLRQVTDELDAATWVVPFEVPVADAVLVVGFYGDGTSFSNFRFGDGGGVGSGDQAADGVIIQDRCAMAYFLNPSTASGLSIRADIPGDGCLGAWTLSGMNMSGTIVTSQVDTITTTVDEMFVVAWGSGNTYNPVTPGGSTDLGLPVDLASHYAGGGTGTGTGGSTLAPTAGTYNTAWGNDGNGSPLAFAFQKAPPTGGTVFMFE